MSSFQFADPFNVPPSGGGGSSGIIPVTAAISDELMDVVLGSWQAEVTMSTQKRDLLQTMWGVSAPPAPVPPAPAAFPVVVAPVGPSTIHNPLKRGPASPRGAEPSTAVTTAASGPHRALTAHKRVKTLEPCLGCGLSAAGPTPLSCLGTSGKTSNGGTEGGPSEDSDCTGGTGVGSGKAKKKTTGRGVCDRFEDFPDTVVAVDSKNMWVTAHDIRSQALRIMYRSWGLLAHHKLRLPGDDKTVAFTVLVMENEAVKENWLSYYGPGRGARQYSYELTPWDTFVAAHANDWVAQHGDEARLTIPPDGLVPWRSCRVHRLRSGPGRYIGKMCMLCRFRGSAPQPVHDKCLDCYPHAKRSSKGGKRSPASSRSASRSKASGKPGGRPPLAAGSPAPVARGTSVSGGTPPTAASPMLPAVPHLSGLAGLTDLSHLGVGHTSPSLSVATTVKLGDAGSTRASEVDADDAMPLPDSVLESTVYAGSGSGTGTGASEVDDWAFDPTDLALFEDFETQAYPRSLDTFQYKIWSGQGPRRRAADGSVAPEIPECIGHTLLAGRVAVDSVLFPRYCPRASNPSPPNPHVCKAHQSVEVPVARMALVVLTDRVLEQDDASSSGGGGGGGAGSGPQLSLSDMSPKDVALTIKDKFPSVCGVHLLPTPRGVSAIVVFDTERDAEDVIMAEDDGANSGAMVFSLEVHSTSTSGPDGALDLSANTLVEESASKTVWNVCAASAGFAGSTAHACQRFGFGLCPLLRAGQTLVATDHMSVHVALPLAKLTVTPDGRLQCMHCVSRKVSDETDAMSSKLAGVSISSTK